MAYSEWRAFTQTPRLRRSRRVRVVRTALRYCSIRWTMRSAGGRRQLRRVS